jgi:uncharacterized protein (DUF2267 family)
MTYASFIETVERETGEPRPEAERAVAATLETLGERLSGGEAGDIAAQLPRELQAYLADDGSDARGFGVEEFIRRVARLERIAPAHAARHVRAVFAALGRTISHDELDDMASELGRDYAELLGVASSARRAEDAGEVRALISAETFWRRVAQRTGLDLERAKWATDAALEALADRISGGEVDDLKEQLPRELHAPLERGKAESNGAARRLSTEEFVRGVAEREGVTPAEAEDHARAVFATLRETLDDKEFSDFVAQLPEDYAALLARA